MKIGDRVVYTNNFLKPTGTILGPKTQVEAAWKIEWDDRKGNGTNWAYEGNLRLIPSKISKEEIDRALAVLKQAGEVTFKLYKPPFEAITIEGIGSYKAVVTDEHVTVGCTRISFSKVKEIALAVKKAQEYNRS